MTIQDLPVGANPPALSYMHFPVPFLAVIWRNWNRVAPHKIAEVLHTTEANVIASAEMLGLVRDDRALAAFRDRGFLTIIRCNWQLLNYEQLLQLLDWTPERLEFTLLEDDFLFIKLSQFKPQCDMVYYRELTPEEVFAARRIGEWMRETDRALPPVEAPFTFLSNIGKLPLGNLPDSERLRMIFSYSAICGDSLLPESPDPYPEALLHDYAASGVNAVWLPGILYQLVPYLGEEMELSRRHEERLARLKELAQRCRKYGIGLFLYFNEPRGIPKRIQLAHEEWRSVTQKGTNSRSFCPWAPGMLENLSRGFEMLARAVPELGGIYTISMSENLTHCLARPAAELESPCPQCAKHSPAENVAAVLTAIHDGICRAGSSMRQIAYTWGWDASWDQKLLAMLPADIEIMSVSETGLATNCRGIAGAVLDYSISKVGPGEQAKRMWQLAKSSGHRPIAKIQVNTTWEMGGVPAIPVPTLVEEHLAKLRALGIDDFMLSWTLGGYPGGNLGLLNESAQDLAKRQFGAAGEAVYRVYQKFGEAFRKIPFNNIFQLYYSPLNVGPANLLYPEKTNLAAGMVCGIPYDDVASWTGNGHYPRDVFEAAFGELSAEWGMALEELRKLGQTLPRQYQANFTDLWNRAEATYCCLRSTFLQTKFINLRDAGKLAKTKDVIAEEEELARRLLAVISADSRIGFEAANHYFYGANELREKIVQCRCLQAKIPAGNPA